MQNDFPELSCISGSRSHDPRQVKYSHGVFEQVTKGSIQKYQLLSGYLEKSVCHKTKIFGPLKQLKSHDNQCKLGIFFFKWTVSLGQECITLNPGVFFIFAVFQVMFCKRPHIKKPNDLEMQTNSKILRLWRNEVFCILSQ